MQRHVKRVLEHLVGPTGSVILHVFIVILLVKFVHFVQKGTDPEVEVVIMEPDAVELDELELDPELLEPPEVVDTVTPPDVNLDMEQPPPVDDFDSSEPEMDFEALDVLDVKSPLVMRGLFAGRSAGGRAAALGAYGGRWGKHTEAAVIKALEWLKRNQAKDGSWGPKNKGAMTGLGLLTFLAHGETPASDQYGPTVEKAIRWLVESQKEDGWLSPKTSGGGGVYEHAIATYSVSEAYGVTRIPMLKPVMDKAIRVIVKGQQPGGGWDYKYAKGERRDASVSGWHIQALKAAYIAGSTADGIKPALDRAVQDLKKHQNQETGMFYYSNAGGRGGLSMTGVGVLCLQLLGHGKTPAARAGVQALKEANVDWEHPIHWALYAWYYVTQSKFHHGGKTWSAWNDRFARVFVRAQNEDGSWTAPEPAKKGHSERNYGPVYSTTLAALSLQVYYRFLPTYKAEAVEAEEQEEESEEIDIQII